MRVGSVRLMASLPLLASTLAPDSNVAEMLAGGCLAAGLILTALGTWQRSVVMRLVANGQRTTAIAVDSVVRTNEHGHAHHHVVWRFQTDEGTIIEHEGLAGALHKPADDDTARIIYDPADPHNARLETVAERTLSWALFLFSGVALLVISLVATILAALS